MGKDKAIKVKAAEIKLEQIREPKYIARTDFDKEEMQELMDSIETHGLIQPIRLKTVRGGFEIVAGHRRFIAHKRLKLETIRAEIVEAVELENEIIKLHENKKRTDLGDIEEARSYEHLKKISKMTNKQIAKHANTSEGYITQKLLIMKYPACLFNALASEQITFSAARELVRITDLKVLEDYVDHACRSGITPRVAKQWTEDWMAMNKLQRGDVEQEMQRTGETSPDNIKLPCFVCSHYFKPENTHMIRICKNDLDAIKKAMKIKDVEDAEEGGE